MRGTGWWAWSKKSPIYMDSCRECNSGKCKACNGSGYVTHVCSENRNCEVIHVWNPKWSSWRETLIRCTTCGKYYMLYADIDPGAGSSYFSLGVGESCDYHTFTQAELNRLLAGVERMKR